MALFNSLAQEAKHAAAFRRRNLSDHAQTGLQEGLSQRVRARAAALSLRDQGKTSTQIMKFWLLAQKIAGGIATPGDLAPCEPQTALRLPSTDFQA